MKPKKIYLNEQELHDAITCERMVSCNEPYRDMTEEYINLRQIWHDASEEPEIGSNIVAIDSDGIWWDIQPYSDCDYDWNGLKGWRSCVRTYDIQKWAYISDLLPM